MDTTYNGWPNYETWAVHLWLTNDKVTYNQVYELLKDNPERAADNLSQFVEDQSPLADDETLYHDLLSRALGRVDWQRVADAFLEQ